MRIGVAAAKGFCFALDLPLIALNSLEVLVQSVVEQDIDFIIPMLDARRMEVYTALFDGRRQWRQQTSALVLSQDSFKDIVGVKKVLVLGDGAKKFVELNPLINVHYVSEKTYPNALNMVELAWEKYANQDFESLGYFEPFYLKDFQITPSKKKMNV